MHNSLFSQISFTNVYAYFKNITFEKIYFIRLFFDPKFSNIAKSLFFRSFLNDIIEYFMKNIKILVFCNRSHKSCFYFYFVAFLSY